MWRDGISRRQALSGIGAGMAWWLGGSRAAVGAEAPPSQRAAGESDARGKAGRKRVGRVAHITDVHVQPELGANDGLIACLRHLQGQSEKPDFVLNTGDSIMDSMSKDAARTELQWNLWRDILRGECALPVEHCIGNHDIWGWNRKKSGTAGTEALWGKRRALDAFGLDRPYRSFDRFGWHFVVLDSVQPFQDAYRGGLDDEQFAWLAADLKAVPAGVPVLVASHIPIVSAAAHFGDGKKRKKAAARAAAATRAAGGAVPSTRPTAAEAGNADAAEDVDAGDPRDWVIPGGAVFLDGRRVKDLFAATGNVKACVSGHIHELDEIRYLCNGAVSGAWWKGRKGQCEPGYTLLDLYDDGTVEHRYVEYGWTPRA